MSLAKIPATVVTGFLGAGKTTLLRALTGIVAASSGAVGLDGAPIASRSPRSVQSRRRNDRQRKRIGRIKGQFDAREIDLLESPAFRVASLSCRMIMDRLAIELVVLTIGYHHYCKRLLRDFEALHNRRSHRWFRVFNEVSVLLFAMDSYVLLALPAALAIALSFISPDHMKTLFEARMGRTMIMGAIVMQTIGFIWIRRVIKIEV